MEDKPYVVVLLGAPGAGKGTQGMRLAARAEIAHVSTGDLFRDAVNAESPAGQRAEAYLKNGQLVPDQVVLQLLEEFLGGIESLGVCLDGFPRTYEQAVALEELLSHFGLSINLVLHLHVTDTIALERLVERGRVDDTIDTARYRLEVYHSATEPLIKYYNKSGLLIEIDGSGDADAVESRVWDAVEMALI